MPAMRGGAEDVFSVFDLMRGVNFWDLHKPPIPKSSEKQLFLVFKVKCLKLLFLIFHVPYKRTFYSQVSIYLSMGHKTFTMATESDHIMTKFKEGFSILSIFKLPLRKINKEVILINWYF